MSKPPSMELGLYLLVRPHRSKHLRIYEVYARETGALLATIFTVRAEEYRVAEEWHVRCHECGATPILPTRDRSLAWLGRHRVTKHPDSVRKEGT